MKTKKRHAKSGAVKPSAAKRTSKSAYGDNVPICANSGCRLRIKAKCCGFEGCPGFRAR